MREYLDFLEGLLGLLGEAFSLIDGLVLAVICALVITISVGAMMFERVRRCTRFTVAGRTCGPGLGDALLATAVLVLGAVTPYGNVTGVDLLIGAGVAVAGLALLAAWSVGTDAQRSETA